VSGQAVASHNTRWYHEEAEIRRIVIRGQPRQKVLQNNQSKMDWRCGPSGKVPTLQGVQTLVASKKKKRKKERKKSKGKKSCPQPPSRESLLLFSTFKISMNCLMSQSK
jgi:hypothetical protein